MGVGLLVLFMFVGLLLTNILIAQLAKRFDECWESQEVTQPPPTLTSVEADELFLPCLLKVLLAGFPQRQPTSEHLLLGVTVTAWFCFPYLLVYWSK